MPAAPARDPPIRPEPHDAGMATSRQGSDRRPRIPRAVPPQPPSDPVEIPPLPAGLDTPALVVFIDRVAANIDRLQRSLDLRGVRLRPHAKTHKSVRIARLQLEAGAAGLTVGTLGEAEVFALAGIRDLFIAYPVWAEGPKASRLRALHAAVDLRVGVDSVGAAERLAAAVVRIPPPAARPRGARLGRAPHRRRHARRRGAGRERRAPPRSRRRGRVHPRRSRLPAGRRGRGRTGRDDDARGGGAGPGGRPVRGPDDQRGFDADPRAGGARPGQRDPRRDVCAGRPPAVGPGGDPGRGDRRRGRCDGRLRGVRSLRRSMRAPRP